MRRMLLVAVLLGLVAPALAQAGPTAAAAETAVTGSVTSREKIALSPQAVTVVTLVDQQAGANTPVIIGQQTITGGQFPIAFSVPYGVIDPTHSYALFASVMDGGAVRQTFEAVPAITGGPTTGLALPVLPVSATATATVTGTITKADKTALSGAAVAYALLVDTDTGTLIARQVIPSASTTPVAFRITYDPGIINPAATYVVKASIVDTGKAWENRTGLPAVTNGAPSTGLSLPVAIVGTAQPTAAPTAAPTAKPTAKPTAAPTAKPTAAPTAKPTAAPTAAPTAKPTAAPTAAAHSGAYRSAHGGADSRTDRRTHRSADGHAKLNPDGEPQRDSVRHRQPDARADHRDDHGHADLGGAARDVRRGPRHRDPRLGDGGSHRRHHHRLHRVHRIPARSPLAGSSCTRSRPSSRAPRTVSMRASWTATWPG